MLKSALVQAVADSLGEEMSKRGAQKIVDTVLEEILNGVKADGIVQIAGFGTFKKKYRPARIGPKPGTKGEKMQYPASTTCTFKAGKDVKSFLHEEE